MVDEKKTPSPAPGNHLGKIVNYGVKKTKSGDPAPTIAFEVVGPDAAKHRVFWQGSFNGGGRDIAVKALMICGFKDIRSLARLADGPTSRLLDMSKDIDLSIIHEDSQDGAKRYAKVNWINEVGGGKFKDAVESKEAASLFAGLGLEADFFRIAQENGYKLGGAPVARSEAPPPHEATDIPF